MYKRAKKHEYVDKYVLGIVRHLVIYYRACRPLGAVYILNKRVECTKTCRSTCSQISTETSYAQRTDRPVR